MKSLKKQGGFTLLELLVVVGLMAAVAVVAVSTYDDADASATIATDLSNIQSIDQGIRNFAGKNNGKFPEQLDSLLTDAGNTYVYLAPETQNALQKLDTKAANPIANQIMGVIEDGGMDEFQFVLDGENTTAKLVTQDPNAVHAEASGKGLENDADTADSLTIVANKLSGTKTCTIDAFETTTVNTLAAKAPKLNVLNAINDQLEVDVCNVVVALGVGGDAAANSEGTIGATSSDAIKDRKVQYSRYLALFHVAQDGINNLNGVGNGVISADEVFAKPRFIGVINPLGQGTNELNKLKNTQ